MFRWLLFCAVLCAGAYALVDYGVPELQKRNLLAGGFDGGDGDAPLPPKKADPAPADQPSVHVFPSSAPGRARPLAVPEARLLAVDRQEVPGERSGVLVAIGTEVPYSQIKSVPPDKLQKAVTGFLAIEVGAADPAEQVPADQTFPGHAGSTKRYRRWKEDDKPVPGAMIVMQETRYFRRLEVGEEVRAGQLVAQIDPMLALKELAIKNAQIDAAESERKAANKTRGEFERRYAAMVESNRRVPGSVSKDDLEATKLQAERYAQEEIAKGAALIKAHEELKQALAVLSKHEVRSAIDGTVKVIYKNRGDAVKELDPIVQLQNSRLLRVEGLIDEQEARRIKPGTVAVVEPTRPESPQAILSGHLHEVTGVAVSKGPRLVIVSGSEDRSLRGWDAKDGSLLWLLPHRTAVRAVACTGPDAAASLALAGCADGSARIVNLDDLKARPVELAERHRGAVTCAAFSPDGRVCATGGDDRAICLWRTDKGELIHRLTHAHRAAVTSVAFTRDGQLVSAGRDNSLTVWSADHPPVRVTEFERRSGDVTQLGVSPDGRYVLFDAGKELRVLSLADRQIEGVLQNPSGATNFTTMALFAPDGKTILTNAAAEGRLQLWRAPTDKQPRAAELRQFTWGSGAATCGAFAPDGSFAVTGTQDNRVLVWPMPARDEINQTLTARVSLVERNIEGAARQVRIWAELQNPGWLLPGGTATMVIFPEAPR